MTATAGSSVETNVVPLVTDNPTNPTIGNVSVNFSPAAGFWLMTYDGGWQKEDTTEVILPMPRRPGGRGARRRSSLMTKRDLGLNKQ